MRVPAPGCVELWVGPAPECVPERVLARYLGGQPEIELGEHGKPRLRAGRLEFNRSDAGGLGAIAVTAGSPVGVDIESERGWRDPLGFARRFLAEEEADALAALPEDRRGAALTRLWTAKEAYVKAVGTGLMRTPPRSFVIAGGAVVQTHDGSPAALWSLAPIAMPAGFTGTVAMRGALACLRVFECRSPRGKIKRRCPPPNAEGRSTATSPSATSRSHRSR